MQISLPHKYPDYVYQSVAISDVKPASPTPPDGSTPTWVIIIAVVMPATLALAVGILWRRRHLAKINSTIDTLDAEEALYVI